MALIFYVDKVAGSNNNSGSSEGNPKVSGTQASYTSGSGLIDLSLDSPDLSSVVPNVDTIRLESATGGLWDAVDIFIITSVDNILKTVTVGVATPTNTNINKNWAIGGAFVTLQRGIDVRRAGVASEITYVKSSATYTENATSDHGLGVDQGWGLFEGYSTVPGDNGIVTIDGSASRAYGLGTSNSDSWCVFKNFRLTNHTTAGFKGTVGGATNELRFINIESDNNGTNGIVAGEVCIAHRCYVHDNGGDGIFFATSNCAITCCIAINNVAIGLRLKSGVFYRCLSKGNGTDNFYFASAIGGGIMMILDCLSDGNGKITDNGINFFADPVGMIVCLNNLVYDCGSGIVAQVSSDEIQVISENNLLNANTANYSNFATHNGEVTSTPSFIDRTNNDYTPSGISPVVGSGIDIGTIGFITLTGEQNPIGGILQVSSGPADYPSINDVRYGVLFNSNTQSGTLVLPSVNDVRDGIGFGAP